MVKKEKKSIKIIYWVGSKLIVIKQECRVLSINDECFTYWEQLGDDI